MPSFFNKHLGNPTRRSINNEQSRDTGNNGHKTHNLKQTTKNTKQKTEKR